MLLRGGTLFVIAIDWNQITGGSLLNAILIAGSIAAAAVYAVRSVKRDNAETASNAIQSYKSLYEATLAELTTERDARSHDRETAAAVLLLEQEARASVGEALDEAVARSHQLELAVKDREGEIAALNARPDTDQMLRTFEEHHTENQTAMRVMIDNQTAALEALARVGEGITKLLALTPGKRASDQ
jgi:hypothetical protein